MTYYFLRIESAKSDGNTYVYTYDDLDGVTASAKRALRRLPETGQLTLNLIETDRLGPNGEDVRTVTQFTGDADIVATVLKKKLTVERKAQNDQPDLAWSPSSDVEPVLSSGGE